jgi:hypothetical protein
MAHHHPHQTTGHHPRRWLLAAGSVGLEAVPLWRRGYGLGGQVVVRCRDGHLFCTLWVPAASLKAVRLGPWRIQRCPVGHHWTLVTPVDRTQLTPDELRLALETRDIRIP